MKMTQSSALVTAIDLAIVQFGASWLYCSDKLRENQYHGHAALWRASSRHTRHLALPSLSGQSCIQCKHAIALMHEKKTCR